MERRQAAQCSQQTPADMSRRALRAARPSPARHRVPLELLGDIAQPGAFHEDVSIAVLTPGVFNSAYSSMPFWRARWGWSWWKAVTC